MRACPVCFETEDLEVLHSYETVFSGQQHVFACVCGMVFSSVGKPVDYAHSVYGLEQAVGSGESDNDRMRLDHVAETIEQFTAKDVRILDCGCARGGMLDALKRRGFTNISGLDPSPDCVATTRNRGHAAQCGYLTDVEGKYDLIILSHVLEHIENVRGFLIEVRNRLTPDGRVYIEVPNAIRYVEFNIPFLDFNAEHINHFDMVTLMAACKAVGMEVVKNDFKKIPLVDGASYPAMYVLASRRMITRHMLRYVHESQESMAKFNAHLEVELAARSQVVLWGAGNYLAHVLALPVFQRVQVVQIVDKNPSLWGKTVAGITIGSDCAFPELPIVISSLANSDSIRKTIVERGHLNHIITLEGK